MTFHIFSLSVCQKNRHTRCCEIIAIVAALAVALLVSGIPFIHTAYGWSEGFTCWIRTINITSCEPFASGQEELRVFWFIWFVITYINIVSLIFSIRALYRQFRMEGGQSQFSMQFQYRQALKEAVALLVYMAIINVLSWVNFFAAQYGSSQADSWIHHAIPYPLL